MGHEMHDVHMLFRQEYYMLKKRNQDGCQYKVRLNLPDVTAKGK